MTDDTEAVSPVIGTILMVAVTVMLAAGVYVWTTVFNDDGAAPEDATIRATGLDGDGDGRVEWLRLTLVSGADAPYHHDVIGLQVLTPSGTSLDDTSLCEAPSGAPCTPASGEWDVGTSTFIPCQETGNHLVTLTIRGHTVLDQSLSCNTAA